MENAASETVIYGVDAEHAGIRTALLLAFLGGAVGGYLLGAALFSGGNFSILAIAGALIGAYAASNITERLLVGRWPSGRAVEIDAHSIRIVRKGKIEHVISGETEASGLLWRFEIHKKARVPQGWLMLACALEQESRWLVVYTFMSPQQYEKLEDGARYTRLLSQKDKSVDKDLRLAGQQRRLHAAESYRWAEGAEMKADDFLACVAKLRAQFRLWVF